MGFNRNARSLNSNRPKVRYSTSSVTVAQQEARVLFELYSNYKKSPRTTGHRTKRKMKRMAVKLTRASLSTGATEKLNKIIEALFTKVTTD